jgi:hypothetical protein
VSCTLLDSNDDEDTNTETSSGDTLGTLEMQILALVMASEKVKDLCKQKRDARENGVETAKDASARHKKNKCVNQYYASTGKALRQAATKLQAEALLNGKELPSDKEKRIKRNKYYKDKNDETKVAQNASNRIRSDEARVTQNASKEKNRRNEKKRKFK